MKNARSFYPAEEHVAGVRPGDPGHVYIKRKIVQRLEKQHSIRQERREGFSDDNDAVYAELKHRLGNQTLGDSALPRQMPIDTHVGGLGGLEDSKNRSQETETSLDLSQTSIDWELTFLDSDGSNHGSLDNAGGAVGSQMSNRLSLSLEDSQRGEAGPGASGALEETSGRQDGANTTEGA